MKHADTMSSQSGNFLYSLVYKRLIWDLEWNEVHSKNSLCGTSSCAIEVHFSIIYSVYIQISWDQSRATYCMLHELQLMQLFNKKRKWPSLLKKIKITYWFFYGKWHILVSYGSLKIDKISCPHHFFYKN